MTLLLSFFTLGDLTATFLGAAFFTTFFLAIIFIIKIIIFTNIVTLI